MRLPLIAAGAALLVHGVLVITQLAGALPAERRWLRSEAVTSRWQRELARASIGRIRSTTGEWRAHAASLGAMKLANAQWEAAKRKVVETLLRLEKDPDARKDVDDALREMERRLDE